MRKRQDNRGSTMMIVIVIIAFVSILVATLFTMSVINIQMKSVDRKAKRNFYSAESALEEITLGLQKELSVSSTSAYALVMQQYANKTLEVERRTIFNDKLLDDLKTRLKNGEAGEVYSKALLEGYLSTGVAVHTELDSTKAWQLLTEADSLVLKGLEITYTDAEGYQSVIETDIRLSVPNLNLVQPADMPEVFDYSIIANQQLIADAGGNVTIEAGIYAGEDGLTLTNGAVWEFKQANRVIVKGEILVPKTASLTTTNDMDLWAKELNVTGGTMASRGRTYVANDLVLSNQGSNVTLEGEYYGYGNGGVLTDAGVMLPTGGDSSAILINGIDSTLDMSNIRRLLLSGSAQIATGRLTFDKDRIESMLLENDPSLDDKKNPASLSSGAYYMQSVGNGLLVCSDTEYLQAKTDADYVVEEGSWERFLLYNNSDGTVSLKDPNHLKKYVSVQTEDQNVLLASAETIGVNEKFYLYVITEGTTNYYALKSYANGKFVSIDTYYAEDGTSADGVLCANRDKITDNAQLFLITRFGDLPVEKPLVQPTVTFSYENSAHSIVTFSNPDWGVNGAPAGYRVWITYKKGTEIIKDQEMEYPASRWRAYTDIHPWDDNQEIEYTIRYTVPGGEKTISGTYIHKPGSNNPDGTGTLQNGVYSWHVVYYINNDPTQPAKGYCQATDYGNQRLQFSGDNATENNTSWEMFHLVNNEDGTISLKSQVNMRYVSIQDDGSLIANSDTIGVNEKFKLEFIIRDGSWYYQMITLAEGKGKGKYVCANHNEAGRPAYLTDSISGWEDHFYFDCMRYTDEVGEKTPVDEPEIPNLNPETGMKYHGEKSAKATFTTPYWEGGEGESVTLYYTINGSPLYPAINMDIADKKASCIVPNLKNQDKVRYYFTYTYMDERGVEHTATTSTYIYIHETKYGDAVSVDGQNVNINLGESIEVKSNQIAYLVPPECIGVNEGETLIGKNPMSDAEFARMMSYVGNTTKYPNFEIVSFTKEVEELGGSLDTYRTPGTDGYRTIFVQTAEGTMVYFYVEFDSDNTSRYFRDYYEKNRSALEQYMQNYINEIRLSNRFTRLTANGNMVFSEKGGTGRIDLKSNESYGANLSPVELSGLRNEETGYQKRFKALSGKLMLDYDELTSTEKVRCLFDNIIRYSEEPGDTEGRAFASLPVGTTPITHEVSGVKALVVHNKDAGAFHYNSDPGKEVCLIIATGDVVLEQDFSGVVIARGIVTVKDSAVHNISGNKEALYKILKYRMDPGDPTSETLIEHYFRDGDKYILDGSSVSVATDRDYVSYGDLITYEGWTKR